MEPKVSVLVVNLNNLEFTRNCLDDLLKQDVPFNLRLVDQNSSEPGTNEFLADFLHRHTNLGEFFGKVCYLEIFNTGWNRPLNHLWNDFVAESSTPFCCILNNDVRILPNFLSSAIEVLEREESVGFVNHTTNNKDFSNWSENLEYEVIDFPYRQGWDFIFKKECYHRIPEELTFFYGDDYIYSKLYSSGKRGAYILNSPMIHYESSTTEEKQGIRDVSQDKEFYFASQPEFGELFFHPIYSKWKPEFETFTHPLLFNPNMAHANQQNFIWDVKSKFPKFFNDVKVLDIGSLDVNGNNKMYFTHPYFYVGVDLQPGLNVDVVSPGHLYSSGFEFDTIVSTECFEHDMYWARTLQNMVNLLRSGGLLVFTCASTDRPEHGTLRTSPENAPLLQHISEEWSNYYRNLTERDIRSVLNVTEIFSDFEFREEFSGYIGNDLYFWGIKK